MIVKHSGSLTVFEAFVSRAERDDILAINRWCEEVIPGRFRFSSILPTTVADQNGIRFLKGLRRTFWMDDRDAALLFKLRWLNA